MFVLHFGFAAGTSSLQSASPLHPLDESSFALVVAIAAAIYTEHFECTQNNCSLLLDSYAHQHYLGAFSTASHQQPPTQDAFLLFLQLLQLQHAQLVCAPLHSSCQTTLAGHEFFASDIPQYLTCKTRLMHLSSFISNHQGCDACNRTVNTCSVSFCHHCGNE